MNDLLFADQDPSNNQYHHLPEIFSGAGFLQSKIVLRKDDGNLERKPNETQYR